MSPMLLRSASAAGPAPPIASASSSSSSSVSSSSVAASAPSGAPSPGGDVVVRPSSLDPWLDARGKSKRRTKQATALIPTLSPRHGLSFDALLRHLAVSQRAAKSVVSVATLAVNQMLPPTDGEEQSADDREAREAYFLDLPHRASATARSVRLPLLPARMATEDYWAAGPIFFWVWISRWYAGLPDELDLGLPAPISGNSAIAIERAMEALYLCGMADVDLANLGHRGFHVSFWSGLKEAALAAAAAPDSHSLLALSADCLREAATRPIAQDVSVTIPGAVAPGATHTLPVAPIPSAMYIQYPPPPPGPALLRSDRPIPDTVPYRYEPTLRSRAVAPQVDRHTGRVPAPPPPGLVAEVQGVAYPAASPAGVPMGIPSDEEEYEEDEEDDEPEETDLESDDLESAGSEDDDVVLALPAAPVLPPPEVLSRRWPGIPTSKGHRGADPPLGFTPILPAWACSGCLGWDLNCVPPRPVECYGPLDPGPSCWSSHSNCSHCSGQVSPASATRLGWFRTLVVMQRVPRCSPGELVGLRDTLRALAVDLATDKRSSSHLIALALGDAPLPAESTRLGGSGDDDSDGDSSIDDAPVPYLEYSGNGDLPQPSETSAIPWPPFHRILGPGVPVPQPRTLAGFPHAILASDDVVALPGSRVVRDGILSLVPGDSALLCGVFGCSRCQEEGLACLVPLAMLWPSGRTRRNCRGCTVTPTKVCSLNILRDYAAHRGYYLAVLICALAAWLIEDATHPGSAVGSAWLGSLEAVVLGRWASLGDFPVCPPGDSPAAVRLRDAAAVWERHPWLVKSDDVPRLSFPCATTLDQLGDAPRVSALLPPGEAGSSSGDMSE